MINIAERPAEADDRAVPGHWEGDLIIGSKNLSAIGTLVERTTQLHDAAAPARRLHPRAGPRRACGEDQNPARSAAGVADLGPRPGDGPVETSLHRRRHRHLLLRPPRTLAAATNENTNGLLRQYFPKSSDLSVHTPHDLDWVAAELNDRPRKRLGFKKPIEQIGPLLLR